jgi:hypothetical protein
MNVQLKSVRTIRGESGQMSEFELDRLFGTALTDARFFQHLRERPDQAIARFRLTASEARAVVDMAPAANSIEELAISLDSWRARQESEAAGTHVGTRPAQLEPAAPQLVESPLLQVSKGTVSLAERDPSKVKIEVVSKQYA